MEDTFTDNFSLSFDLQPSLSMGSRKVVTAITVSGLRTYVIVAHLFMWVWLYGSSEMTSEITQEAAEMDHCFGL